MCSAPVGDGAKRTLIIRPHADRRPRIARRRACRGRSSGAWSGAAKSIQIFNQSPRMWKGREYSEDEAGAFREALRREPGPGGRDPRDLPAQLRQRGSRHAPQIAAVADRLAARRARRSARPAWCCTRARPRPGTSASAIKRAAGTIREALAESERLPAVSGGHGRRRRHARAQLRRARRADRGAPAASAGSACAWTPATCWPPAMTSARAPGMDAVMAEFEQRIGLERLGCLHLNDSVTPLGSNRDRHANIGEGELGSGGCAAFLSAPEFDGLPCVLETPGEGKRPRAECPRAAAQAQASPARSRQAGGARQPGDERLAERPQALAAAGRRRARSRARPAARACDARGRRCRGAPGASRRWCGCRAAPRPGPGTPRSPA